VRKQKKQEVIQHLRIEEYAAEGKSLGRVNGKVIFVEQVVPGDVVDVQLGKNKKDWAEGYPIRFHEYASDRVTPFCAHFGVCGGCQWQMLTYEKQLIYKQKQVSDNLERIARVALPPMLPIVGAEITRGYRNKLEYTFASKRFIPAAEFRRLREEAGPGQPLAERSGFAGFHARGMFDKVVEIDTCHLQEEPTNGIRKAIEAYGLENGCPFYDARTHEGWLRNMVIRLATTKELMVNIVVGYEAREWQEALAKNLLEKFPGITTLLFTINPKFNDSIFDLQPRAWHGNGYITERLEDFSFRIGPKSFFQTNTLQAEKLYRVTRDFAELTGEQTVYDLYCGTGSIGIFVSRQAKKVIGVELIEEAVKDARENAALNGILHSEFFTGDVTDICDDSFFSRHGKADVIITDPPRAGMHEKLVKKLLEIAAPLVVYVSCNPATQARDLALLDEKYTVTKIRPVDMFPHTQHIENVVQLKLKTGA